MGPVLSDGQYDYAGDKLRARLRALYYLDADVVVMRKVLRAAIRAHARLPDCTCAAADYAHRHVNGPRPPQYTDILKVSLSFCCECYGVLRLNN